MELAFNELSFKECKADNFIHFFNKWIRIKLLLKLDEYPRIRFAIQQITQKNYQGKTFNIIIKNSSLDEIEKSAIYNQINNEPFINDTYPDKLLFNNNDTFGLTDAYYSDIPCISIPSNEKWDNYIINADEKYLSEDAEILKRSVDVRNIGNIENYIGYIGTWFENIVPQRYTNVTEYIKYIEKKYTHIILSDAIKVFLRKTPTLTIYDKLESSVNKLESSVNKLDDYCKKYWYREHVMWNQIKDLGLNAIPVNENFLRH